MNLNNSKKAPLSKPAYKNSAKTGTASFAGKSFKTTSGTQKLTTEMYKRKMVG